MYDGQAAATCRDSIHVADATSAAPRVVAVASGKSGVGKTTIATNLAISLAARGETTILMDGDFASSKVHKTLGLEARRDLLDVLGGDCSLDEILIEGPGGILVIPAAGEPTQGAELSPMVRAGLLYAFDELEVGADFMILDTAAGMSAPTLDYCHAANDVVVVLSDDAASVADTHALIWSLATTGDRDHFGVIVNMSLDEEAALEAFHQLNALCCDALDVVLELMAVVPADHDVAFSAMRRRPVVLEHAAASASRAIDGLAERLAARPKACATHGGLGFFTARSLAWAANHPAI